LKFPTTVLLLALLATACKTTETRTTMYETNGAPERLGTVTWIKETEKDEKGNPVGGAAIGATVGGLAGYALGGGVAGVVVGAVGGGAAGALLSKGDGEKHWFDVNVRFDQGGEQVFRFENTPPVVVGERVGVVGNTMRSLGARVVGAPAGQTQEQQQPGAGTVSQPPAKSVPSRSN
jgi:outer membrane lipoprotein SlyB